MFAILTNEIFLLVSRTMKSIILAIVIASMMMVSNSFGADAAKEKTLTWSFSAESSYPRKKTTIKPAELGKQLADIQALDKSNPLESGCSEAIGRYAELLNKYPDSMDIYRFIPACNLGENALSAIMSVFAREKAASALKIDPRQEDFFRKGEVFFSKVLNDSTKADVWDAYLSYRFARGGFDFSKWIFTDAAKLLSEKRPVDDSVMKHYTQELQTFIVWMASNDNVTIARRMHDLEPSNPRYSGILGSLMVGNAFTGILNDFLNKAKTLKTEPTGDEVLLFFRERGKAVSSQLDEALDLLTPLCQKKHIDQACKDVELAKFLKDPKKE